MTDQTDETENHRFRPLREVSRQALSTSGHYRPPMCPSDVATRRAAMLLSCYRKGDAEDPEIYAAAVASILSSYPQAVAYRVTDPRTGIAGKSQWLPTVAEVRAACEAEMAPARASEAADRRREDTRLYLEGPKARIVEVARWQDLIDQIGPAPERPTISPKSEEWMSEFGHRSLTVSAELRAQNAHRDKGDA